MCGKWYLFFFLSGLSAGLDGKGLSIQAWIFDGILTVQR
jgi:hypothetical protein